MTDIDKLLRDLAHPGVVLEIAILLACLLIAFGICWAVGRRKSPESVWFGRGIIDGLAFPLLALLLTYIAKVALAPAHNVTLLRVAMPVLVSLVLIRFLARVFTRVFPDSAMARLVERLFSWVAWMAAVLWIVGLLPVVMEEMEGITFLMGKTRVSLMALVEGLLSLGAVLITTLWVSSAIERRVLTDAVQDLSLRKVANSVIRIVLLLAGLMIALSAVGVDLTALSVLGGAVGVGLGFGMQKIAANYVSGFVILFERSLRIGDMVRVDNFDGMVIDIKARYTLIRSLSGRESIVPNEKLVTERIENLSLADPRILISTDVTVGYDSDVGKVEEILLGAAAATARILADPVPVARLQRLGADGLEYTVQFWIDDPINGQLNVRSEINLRILRGLREAGIEIPFPQRTVHLGGGFRENGVPGRLEAASLASPPAQG